MVIHFVGAPTGDWPEGHQVWFWSWKATAVPPATQPLLPLASSPPPRPLLQNAPASNILLFNALTDFLGFPHFTNIQQCRQICPCSSTELSFIICVSWRYHLWYFSNLTIEAKNTMVFALLLMLWHTTLPYHFLNSLNIMNICLDLSSLQAEACCHLSMKPGASDLAKCKPAHNTVEQE